jgi:hypothetical protein
MALSVLNRCLASLTEVSRPGRQACLDGSVLGDPVSERILTVLDDGLGRLVAVIGLTGFARCHGCVVDQFKEVFAVAGDDSKLFTVLAKGVELVGEGSLELLTGDVGQLSFGDQRFSLSANKLLFQHNNARAVWFLVFQLGNLVCNLLLAVARRLDGGFDVADGLDRNAVLIVAVNELVLELANFVDENTELVSYVADIIVTCFAPN